MPAATDADLLAIAHYLKSLPPQQASDAYSPGTQSARAAISGNDMALLREILHE